MKQQGLKRHPSLQDLSRDHHTALIYARKLRRSAQGEENAGSPAEVAKRFLQFWDQEARLHFREEEEVLLPIYACHVLPSQDEKVQQMLDDHAWFRDAVLELRRKLSTGENLKDLLGEVGQRLQDHVRMEERELFERIQDVLTPEDLADVGQRSQAFREKWRSAQAARGMLKGRGLTTETLLAERSIQRSKERAQERSQYFYTSEG